MKNEMTILNEKNEPIKIELLLNFKIDKIGKEYITYMINNDENKDSSIVYISEIITENNIPRIVDIKEDEAEMVLSFYDLIRNAE